MILAQMILDQMRKIKNVNPKKFILRENKRYRLELSYYEGLNVNLKLYDKKLSRHDEFSNIVSLTIKNYELTYVQKWKMVLLCITDYV